MQKPFWTVERFIPEYSVLSLDIVTLRCPLCGGVASKRHDEKPAVTEGAHGRFFTSMALRCDTPECASNGTRSMTLRTFGAAALIEVEGPRT